MVTLAAMIIIVVATKIALKKPPRLLGVASFLWAWQELNPRPSDYESAALTT
jgi:hypothetical protein